MTQNPTSRLYRQSPDTGNNYSNLLETSQKVDMGPRAELNLKHSIAFLITFFGGSISTAKIIST